MSSQLAKRDEWRIGTWAAEQLVLWGAGSSKPEMLQRLRAEIQTLADDLAGPNPSPVERLLAETAAQDSFALNMLSGMYSAGVTAEGGMTLTQSEHAQRRIDRTHRRLMSTLRTLATVRKLAFPSLQVNIGENVQVNNQHKA